MRNLQEQGDLKRISTEVSADLEITEISRRVLERGGPALLFENVKNAQFPVLSNLFGTIERVAKGLGLDSPAQLREMGELLAFLKQPQPPEGLRDAWQQLPIFKRVLNMTPRTVTDAECQKVIYEAEQVDLNMLPVQTCWPEDAGPLISWGMVATKARGKKRQNLGIYRMQVLGPKRLIMRWLSHRGGALDYAAWLAANPAEDFPVSVTIGADPAAMLAAVTPVPDDLGEHQFAGLLRGAKSELVKCIGNSLLVPANSEFVLEGVIKPGDRALEGPFGDHTGYYNEREEFPVFTVQRITHKPDPVYLTTYTGKPPDEPAILGLALNELFVPLLIGQFPEVVDFYLPPEACSYRVAVVSIRKQYPGHAKRIMFGVWSFLRQFLYTKYIVVIDEDVDARNWQEVLWAVSTRTDPVRDFTLVENTPMDYLDFASPVAELGSKVGIDATGKWSSETSREWGRTLSMNSEVIKKIDQIWVDLGLEVP